MHLPTVDLDMYLDAQRGLRDPAAVQAECERAAQALVQYGALLLHDSRVAEADNAAFLDLLEDYFTQPEAALRRDERPELGYQVGVTLANTERPKCAADAPCLDVIARLAPEDRPLDVSGHAPDPKCRFFWRVGAGAGAEPPYKTRFPVLNAANVVPEEEAIGTRWEGTMDRWGQAMKDAVEGVAEMAAVGMGLPASTFRDAGKYGPHLLAPTASDLRKYGAANTVLAGFHTDLNFLTIHGRSRYPGLHIWARNTGRKTAVKMPPGNYLLVQAGEQLEHLSGGLVKAGFHEVVVNERTLETMEQRKLDFPDRPLIRISSTFFWHLSSDYDLRPIPKLEEMARRVRAEQEALGRDEGEARVYPAILVGEQVQNALKHIKLMTT